MARGARNISECNYVPIVPITFAAPPVPRVRGELREMDFLRLWIPDDFLNTTWLPAINSIMRPSRDKLAKSARRYRHQVTVPDFWLWFARYFATHLIPRQGEPDCIPALKAALGSICGKQRLHKMNAAMQVSEDALVKMFDAFNDLAAKIVHRGSAITIDETMLAYYGHDARALKIWRRIPEKPHQKGLIQWRGVGVFRHSRRRVILVIVPFLPSHRCTPTQAAEKIVTTLLNRAADALHVFLDAGFASEEMFSVLARNDLVYTICIKPPFTGPLTALHSAAIYDLPTGASRSYEYEGHIVQAVSKPSDDDHPTGYITAVVTTGYETRMSDNIRYQRRGTYAAAVSDYLMCSDKELMAKYPLFAGSTKQDRILHATGWDVLAPPPDDTGKQAWTEEALNKMKIPMLQAIVRTLAPVQRRFGKNKPDLIAYIVAHHPQMERNQTRRRVEKASPADLQDLYTQLGLDTSDSAPVIDTFDSHKGAVDGANADLYRYIRLSGHRSWRAFSAVSILHALSLNAWASWEERVLTKARHSDGVRDPIVLDRMKKPFVVFITTALQQVVAEYKGVV